AARGEVDGGRAVVVAARGAGAARAGVGPRKGGWDHGRVARAGGAGGHPDGGTVFLAGQTASVRRGVSRGEGGGSRGHDGAVGPGRVDRGNRSGVGEPAGGATRAGDGRVVRGAAAGRVAGGARVGAKAAVDASRPGERGVCSHEGGALPSRTDAGVLPV